MRQSKPTVCPSLPFTLRMGLRFALEHGNKVVAAIAEDRLQ
jgi:hypothetical protein